jgi:hypothetical protein
MRIRFAPATLALLSAGAVAASLPLAASSPAHAACSYHCYQTCTYEVAGRCYAYTPRRCDQTCSLPNGKTISVGGDGTVTITRRKLSGAKTALQSRPTTLTSHHASIRRR